MDALREQIRATFARDFETKQPPSGLRDQVVHSTVVRATMPKRSSAAWAFTTAGAVLMVAVIGGLFFALRASRQLNLLPANSPPAATVSASPSTSVSPSKSAYFCQPTDQAGCLNVTPNSGTVGSVVVLEGIGCNNPGHPTYLAFEGQGAFVGETGSVGAADLPEVPTDSNRQFRTTYTIPANLHSLQGQGGGPTRPGTYDFVSLPVACQVQFTVLP